MVITSIKELRYFIRSDAFRLLGGGNLLSIVKLYISNICFRYLVWLRICNYACRNKLMKCLLFYAFFRYKHLTKVTSIQIPCSTDIGPGFLIGHFGTIVISGDAIIGKNVNISQGVCIGQANRGKNKGAAVIGNEVYFGPGAKTVGAVKIGNNVAIGANAVVTKDIPENCVVAGIPAKQLSMDGAIGYINRKIK